jgi:colicin import membrane protein
MRPNSPSAFFASLLLHGFVIALLAVSTLYLAQTQKVAPAIIELVAGPPTAPDALEAPAAGNTPNPVKMTVPKVELPAEKPEPQAVETPAAPEPVPPKPPQPAKATPPPRAKSDLPTPDTSMAKQMNKQARISYQDYIKKHPTPKQSAVNQVRNAAKAPQVDVQGIVGGIRGGSTANTRGGGGGKAMTREEADQLATYISFLMQELKRAYEPPPGVSDQLSAKVTFDITASGAILNPRIVKSSGNRDFDNAVLDAFRRARSIGPTPNRRPDTWTITFQMKDDA